MAINPQARKYRLFREMTRMLAGKLRPPYGIILGSPHEAAELADLLASPETFCYQMDLFQGDRVEQELAARLVSAEVKLAADLWDLPADRQTLIYPAPHGGERSLKLDMLEQAFHVLKPHGMLVVLSTYDKDQFFPQALKKIFGKVHMPQSEDGAIFWCQRVKEHARRRHEMVFHVSGGLEQSLRFVSRPGVFCYGRFDEGARALVETVALEPGQALLDLGCGAGTNGIICGLKSGGPVTFVDSNLRAVALAELNAKAAGLTQYQTLASSTLHVLTRASFDIVLANPPYHAQTSIARFFVDRGFELLKPGGKLYLVTKNPNTVAGWMTELTEDVQAGERRGYVILCATKPATA